MKSRKTELKKKIKSKTEAWVTAGSPSDNYGFGSNWTLNIGQKGKKPKKQMWLGQGAKVTGRMLGADYGDYVRNVSERAKAKKQFGSEKDWITNPKVNEIVTQDILQATMGDDADVKKLLGIEDWGLAVQ